MNRIGLIAGNKSFPLLFVGLAKKKNPDLKIIAVAVKGETSRKLSKRVDEIHWVSIGQLKEVIDIFVREGIKDVIMAGQISPYRIFKDRHKWDELMTGIYENIPDFRPHSIFTEIITEIEKYNLKFMSSVSYMEDYLAKPGLNNNAEVVEGTKEQIAHSTEIARRIVNLDIGQTTVFKDKAVVAVEALEGTDNTIKRAYKIGGPGLIVVKLARENQDLRFDVPIVGLSTIKLLAKIGVKALVLEQGRTLILDKPEVLSFADKSGIPIVGV